jgi:hypothetical protein
VSEQPEKRSACAQFPAWCVRHSDGDGSPVHWSEVREFVQPSFYAIRVVLSQCDVLGTRLDINGVQVRLDACGAYPGEAKAMAQLLRKLGHEDIAAAVEELAALAAGKDGQQ